MAVHLARGDLGLDPAARADLLSRCERAVRRVRRSGGVAPHWAGFSPGALTVPEIAIARRGEDVRLTVAVIATPDDVPDELVANAERRLAELRATPLPLLDP